MGRDRSAGVWYLLTLHDRRVQVIDTLIIGLGLFAFGFWVSYGIVMDIGKLFHLV